MPDGESPLPPSVREALGGIPKALVPATIKALDRLIGGVIDVPAAWLAQKKAQIDAQTEGYKAVEAAIAKAAAAQAGANPDFVFRAVEVLVRKSYQQQFNREAVARAAIEELHSEAAPERDGAAPGPEPAEPPDDEWLNVFEQYAERASTERMQRLWGRVLAGEVRKPGAYSMRTLRFLAEFSQADALAFEAIAAHVFGGVAVKKALLPTPEADISGLLSLESIGLLEGVTGLGLHKTMRFGSQGWSALYERNLVLGFRGEPGTPMQIDVIVATSMAQELLSLLPNRDPMLAARNVANAIKSAATKEAVIGVMVDADPGTTTTIEQLWKL